MRDTCLYFLSLHGCITGTVDVKCDRYWPKKVGSVQTFDYVEVHNVDEEDFVQGQVILRYLNLKSKCALKILSGFDLSEFRRNSTFDFG